MLTRRALLGALVAPAIIRPGILMPVKQLWVPPGFLPCDGRRVTIGRYPLLANILTDYGFGPLPFLPGHVIATGAGQTPAGSIFAVPPGFKFPVDSR